MVVVSQDQTERFFSVKIREKGGLLQVEIKEKEIFSVKSGQQKGGGGGGIFRFQSRSGVFSVVNMCSSSLKCCSANNHLPGII